MKHSTVLISGLIGLLFGVLFSGSIGLDFFKEEDNNTNNSITRTSLNLDEDGFKVAYGLGSNSIYIPIYGDDVYDMIDRNESFILYIGRDTCPYCQQLVPALLESALEHGYEEIYHVDILDSNNQIFVQEQNVNSVPLTIVFKNGVSEEVFLGYRSKTDIDAILGSIIEE